jgi:folate-binding Fe-S cluster repair protein YgfZ
MLYDTFIYPVNVGVNFPHPRFIIDCPTSSKQNFMRHLKRYILRSKVKLRDCSDEYQLWNIWGHALNAETLDPALVKKEKRFSDIGCSDPRIPGFGYRAVLKRDQGNVHICIFLIPVLITDSAY